MIRRLAFHTAAVYTQLMNARVAQLVQEALLLPSEARSELVEALLEHTPASPEAHDAQIRSIQARIANVAAGKSRLIAEEEAHQSVLDSLPPAK